MLSTVVAAMLAKASSVRKALWGVMRTLLNDFSSWKFLQVFVEQLIAVGHVALVEGNAWHKLDLNFFHMNQGHFARTQLKLNQWKSMPINERGCDGLVKWVMGFNAAYNEVQHIARRRGSQCQYCIAYFQAHLSHERSRSSLLMVRQS